jgi:predicted amidohydrolase
MNDLTKVGIAQAAPVHLDLEKSLKKLLEQVDNAGSDKVQVLVLGETWLSGYPAWIDYCEGVAIWDDQAMKEVYRKMHGSAIQVPGPETEQISQRAQMYSMSICVGVNEKVLKGRGNGTIYNSLLLFDQAGRLVIHRRKLMPTFSEKLLYGQGDGKDLHATDTSAGRIGGLICWEHWMPLTRQAMHNSGEHIHVGLWPTVHEKHQLASRHYAFEGRCFVLAAGQLMPDTEIPKDLAGERNHANLLRGGSCIIDPKGDFVVDPVFDEERLITAEIDVLSVVEERMTLDVSGHYQRDDVFSFEVNQTRKS